MASSDPRARVALYHADQQVIELRAKLVAYVSAAGDALLELSQIGSVEDLAEFPQSAHARVQTALQRLREVFPNGETKPSPE